MELSERIENLGGGSSAYAGYGGIGLFLMAIFLIILFAAFRQHNNGGDMASVANALGEFHPRENCADKLTWSRKSRATIPRSSVRLPILPGRRPLIPARSRARYSSRPCSSCLGRSVTHGLC